MLCVGVDKTLWWLFLLPKTVNSVIHGRVMMVLGVWSRKRKKMMLTHIIIIVSVFDSSCGEMES